MNNTNLPKPDRDEGYKWLDDLIRRASSPEIDRLALERLVRQWQREMAAPLRARRWLPLAAAACLGLLATALVVFLARPWDRDRQGTTNNSRDAGTPAESKGQVPETSDSPMLAENAADAPIEPRVLNPAEALGAAADSTPYEQLIIVAAMRQSEPIGERRARAVRRDIVDRLTALDRIDDRAAEQMAMDLGISIADLERELGPLCRVLRGPRGEKAVTLLARVATRQSLDVLLQLWPQAAHQERLTPAVARLANRATLAACYAQARSSASRRLLAESLVKQVNPTPDDVGLVMDLFTRSQQSAELIAAVRKADGAITDGLFAALDAENRAVRYDAARALGALNQPQVTRRLIERVASGSRRKEAILALAASDEPAAVEFVAQARRHIVLATALQSALVQAGASQTFFGG